MIDKKIENLYKTRYLFKQFYPKLIKLINQNEFLFSNGLKITESVKEEITCTYGDKKIDLPISFGNINAKYKLAILGLEPRDSNSKFNIERQGNFVFGSPFGIEHWSPKDKYYKSFKEILKRNDCFIYFTDVVKEYEVKNTKSEADRNARKTFWNKAASTGNITFLRAEFQIIKPTHIIALGSETYKFLNVHFGEKVFKVTHPNARQNKLTKENAWDAINRQLQLIFENEPPK